jgi:hypothetical protein
MVRALTKTDQTGNRYTRPDVIEAAIEAAMKEDLDTLGRRAWLSDPEGSEFLPLECLVYLLREARGCHDDRAMSTLLPPLLARCETILKATIRHHAFPNVEEIREDILGDFGVLFARDGFGDNPNELDFYECRFERAFRFFRLAYLRRERSRLRELSSLPDCEPDGHPNGEEVFARVSKAFRTQPAQIGQVLHRELVKAIDDLPSDERKVVVLCLVLGLKEESDDPSVITAATLCGVTGRTVRNRLTRAKQKLSNFQESERLWS